VSSRRSITRRLPLHVALALRQTTPYPPSPSTSIFATPSTLPLPPLPILHHPPPAPGRDISQVGTLTSAG